MIISDEEWIKFIKDGQKFALEILGEDFTNDDEEVGVMEEVIMATLPNKELNRLIKIEIAVENLIENGILDEDVYNQYLKEA